MITYPVFGLSSYAKDLTVPGMKKSGYSVLRPRGGPNEDKLRKLIDIQQEGEIAFQLGEMTRLQVTQKKGVLESKTYEA